MSQQEKGKLWEQAEGDVEKQKVHLQLQCSLTVNINSCLYIFIL